MVLFSRRQVEGFVCSLAQLFEKMRPDLLRRISVVIVMMTYVSACQREAAEKLSIVMRVRGVCLRGVDSPQQIAISVDDERDKNGLNVVHELAVASCMDR
jgi:hypothetical protein